MTGFYIGAGVMLLLLLGGAITLFQNGQRPVGIALVCSVLSSAGILVGFYAIQQNSRIIEDLAQTKRRVTRVETPPSREQLRRAAMAAVEALGLEGKRRLLDELLEAASPRQRERLRDLFRDAGKGSGREGRSEGASTSPGGASGGQSGRLPSEAPAAGRPRPVATPRPPDPDPQPEPEPQPDPTPAPPAVNVTVPLAPALCVDGLIGVNCP